MQMAAPALEAAEHPQRWLNFLRAEFAPTPGRLNATVRIVVAAMIVLVTSMALEVPSIAVSLFIVIFLTMLTPGAASQNAVAVAIASIAAIVVFTLTVALTLLIFRFTIDYPPLRLAAMALGTFLGMFAFRVLAVPAAGFIVAIIILVTQSYVDLFPGPEPLARAVLWVWLAIAYPAAVAVVVNFLLLPADPEPLLRREVAERFRALGRAMTAPRGSDDARAAAASLAAFSLQGAAPLLKLLKLAVIRDSTLGPLRAERTAKIVLIERLVASASLLADLAVDPSPAVRARLARIAAACDGFAHAVSSGDAAPPVPPSAVGEGGDAPPALAPVLAELERVVRELPLAERPEIDQPAHGPRLFVPDALTNPDYPLFALKAMLAGMLCYVAYTAVDWNGIHTSMITCVIVALGSAGATIHKATLRLVGCGIAGVLALASIVFVVPHMTSITELMLLVAVVTAPAAWIAMGSERTAYMGLQIAFTFYLAVLQGFGPSADVTEFRDRFVGIVFGVVVMALVFAFVWPERAGSGMARSLAAALRRMAELARGAGDLRAPRAAAWQSLAEADRLAEVSAFEPEALSSPGAKQDQRMRGLIDLARRVLLVQAALMQHRATAPPVASDAVADAAQAALGRAVAAALTGTANRIETGAAGERADLRAPLGALGARRAAAPLGGELALSAALVERVETLQEAAGST